jgi:hypothetical protein
MEIYTFILVFSSALLAYSTYKFYTLLESEKRVSQGLKSALNAVLAEKQQPKPKTRKKTK